jgi:hypothetical protein
MAIVVDEQNEDAVSGKAEGVVRLEVDDQKGGSSAVRFRSGSMRLWRERSS